MEQFLDGTIWTIFGILCFAGIPASLDQDSGGGLLLSLFGLLIVILRVAVHNGLKVSF